MNPPLARWMKTAGLRNKTQLARRVLDRAPGLFADTREEQRPRRVALELTRLEQGKTTWWKNHEDALQALSTVLDVPVRRVLEGETQGESIEFIEFPALRPLEPESELPLAATGGLSHGGNLFRIEIPPKTWSWAQVPPGAGKSLATRILQERGVRADSQVLVQRVRRLAELVTSPHSGQKALYLEVEAMDPETDARALEELHVYQGVLVVASFRRPGSGEKNEEHDTQVFEEEEPRPKWNDVQWDPAPGWRREFAEWVARRLPESQKGFHPQDFTAWLEQMDPEVRVVRTPGELLSLCDLAFELGTARLARQFSSGWRDAGKTVTNRMIQREAMGESNRAFWLRAAGADAVRTLISAALAEVASPWPPRATAADWARRLPPHYAAPASDETLDKTLQSIGQARGSRERQQRITQAKAVLRSPSPLMAIEYLASTRLLRVQGDGTLGPSPLWMVDALARERIEEVLSRDPGTWGRWAADPGRQRLVDEVLEALPSPRLMTLTQKVVRAFDRSSLGLVGAVEALFALWARRFEREPASSRQDVESLHSLARCQLECLRQPALSEPSSSPVSRAGPGDDSTSWLADCWSWSFHVPAPPWPVETALEWFFPGWTDAALSSRGNWILNTLDPKDERNHSRIMARVESVFAHVARASPDWIVPWPLLPAYVAWATRQGLMLAPRLVEELLKGAAPLLPEILQRFQREESVVRVALADTLFRTLARKAGGVGQILRLVDFGDESLLGSRLTEAFLVPSALMDWVFTQLDEARFLRAMAEIGVGSPKIVQAGRLPARFLIHLLRHLIQQQERGEDRENSYLIAVELGRLSARARWWRFGPEHVPLIELMLERGLMLEPGTAALWRLAPERAFALVIQSLSAPGGRWFLMGDALLESMPSAWAVRIIEALEKTGLDVQSGWVLPWLYKQVRAGGALAERAHGLLWRCG